MHIDEIIEERCFGSSNKTVYVCWTSRPIWAWEGQLGLAVTMQDAGVSGAGERGEGRVKTQSMMLILAPIDDHNLYSNGRTVA